MVWSYVIWEFLSKLKRWEMSVWGNAQRVLVVEDELYWQRLFKSILEGEGYEVETVGTYAAAMTELATFAYGLAIVDLNLEQASPGEHNGVHILKHAFHQEVPTLVVSGLGNESIAKSALGYEPRGFVDKAHWQSEEFREKVDEILSPPNIIGKVYRWLSRRLPGVIESLIASMVLLVSGYVFGALSGTPSNWFQDPKALIYISLSVLSIAIFIIFFYFRRQR